MLVNMDSDSRSLVQINSEKDNNRQTDYIQLKPIMLNLFESKRPTTYEHRTQFGKRMQEPYESIRRYFAALYALMDKAFPALPKQHREPILVEQFINGVHNSDIHYSLLKEYNKNSKLSHILNVATMLEASFSTNTTTKAHQQTSTNSNKTNTTSSSTSTDQSSQTNHDQNWHT